MKKFKSILLLFLVAFTLVGCSQSKTTDSAASSTTPTAIPAIAGKGGIIGRIDPIPSRWSNVSFYAYAAPYLGDPAGGGVFMMDDAIVPKCLVDKDGWFQIGDIPAGTYVMVFGTDSENALAYRQEEKAVRFDVQPDQVVNVGVITLEE